MALRVGMVAYTDYCSDPRVRREAEALADRGDEVSVVSLGGTDDRVGPVEVQGIRLPRYRGGRARAYLGSYGGFFARAASKLVRAHQKKPFDVVHVHTMPDFMAFAAAWPKLTGAKLILDMHDLMPDLYALKFGLSRQSAAVRALKAVERLSAGFSDALIAVHEPQAELMVRHGLPRDKITVVMNAADPRLFRRREIEPPTDEAVHVLYHGTVLRRYGVDLALRAFAQAHAEEPRLRLTVLGDGDFLPELRALADALSLPPGVLELTGRREPLDEVARRIRQAHIGLVPNRDDQEDSVLPTKLLEYLAVGIPAVATRTRCIDRYFDDSQVELVDVGDVDGLTRGLLRLVREPDLRKRRVRAGWGWDQAHGFARQRSVLFGLYDRLTS